MSEFDAFAQEVAQEETARQRQISGVTSLGAATTFEPVGGALPEMPAGMPAPSAAMLKPQAPSEFDGFAEDVAREENDKVSAGLKLAAQHDPEAYAKARAIADRDGLPVDFALSNLSDLQKRETVSKMRGALEASPGLREWFKEGDNAALVKLDEVERLSGLTWLAEATGAKWSEAQRQGQLAELRAAEVFGKATPEMTAEAERLSAIEGRELGGDGWLEGGYLGIVGQVPLWARVGGEAFKGGVSGGTIGAAGGGAAGALAGGVGALPGAAAGWAVGFAPGATAFGLNETMRQMIGSNYDEFLKFRSEDGKPLDRDAARLAAVLSGSVGGALEAVSFSTAIAAVPGLKSLGYDQAVKFLSRDGLKAALKRPEIRDVFTNVAKTVLTTAGAEIGTEVAQEAVTMFAGELAKLSSDGEFSFLTAGEWGDRLGEAAVETAKVMTIMGPLFASPGMMRDYSAAKRAERTVGIFTQINEEAKQHGLKDRNPEANKAAVAATVQGTALEKVYVPVERLNELFQSVNVNPADFSDFVGFNDSYAEAMATGGDVEIRFSDFHTKIAGTPLGDALTQHIRLASEEMTAAEAAAFNEAWQETRLKMMEEDVADLQAEATRAAPGEAVFQDVRNKAIAAGRSADVAEQYATVWQAFYSTLAEKTGGDAMSLYQDRGVEIKFAFPEQLSYQKTDDLDLLIDDLRGGREVAIDRERRKALGPDLSSFLRSKGGVQDSGGELRARDVGGRLLDKAGKGMNLDDAALAAWEAGYFPEFGETRPSIDDLLAALDSELSGSPVYQNGLTPEAVDLSTEYLTRLDTMGRTLDELGLSPHSMTNEAIRQELEAVINQDAEQDALFQKDDLGGPRADKRGSIQFGNGRTIINLFEQADLSTFLHESGHFFLEVTRDMALREGAPQGIVDDWQQIKDWLGLADDAVTVDAHEQFARGFEAYLFEGKAPSEGLRGAFARFRSWLTFIYRKVSRLNVNVTPEIKAVFDRMLATEEEINAAANAREFRGWMDQAQAGMEEAEFRAYRELADKATAQAKEDYQARLLADVKRETSREWRENKKAVREEVLSEFSGMPVYQVTHYLRTGQPLSEGGTVPGGRMVLDRAWLVDRYGDSVLTRLPRYVPPIYADARNNKRKDVAVVHPDIVAEAFGYESGDALVQDLLSAPPMARAVVEEVKLRMRDRFGDLMNDQARRAEETTAAMHNDARAQFIEVEMKTLARRGGVKNPMPRQVAARMARDIIAGKKVADATRVGMYAKQEQRAGREAERAIIAGDFKAAAEHKRRQLFAHYLAMEARRAKEDVESATRYLNRFGNRKRPASVDPDYLDQIEGMLERFDLRPATSLRAIERRKRLAGFIAEKEAAGEAIAIPEHLRDEAATQSYKDLVVDDLRALVDSVKNLEHLGRLKNKLILNRRAVDFQNVKDELTASAAANLDERKKIEGFNPNKWEALNLSVLGGAAVMARMEQVIEWLDGGDINGPWRRYLWSPMADAQAREAALRDKVMAPILAVWDSLPKGYLAESHHFASLGRSLKKAEIFALALNTGTESNLQRLLAGEKLRQGGGVDTQDKLSDVLAVLTKRDWDAIQIIWDQINSLWPEASALEKRLTGLEPVKVEAREVVNEHGTYRGGYYPLVYDNAQAIDVSARLMSKEDLKMDPQFARLGREAGYLKTRVDEYGEPLSTKLDVITRHIEKVVHDITHWEAVKETNKVIMDPEIATVLRDHLGQPFHDEAKKWLKRMWHGDDLGTDFNAFQRVVSRLRTNAGIYALAYRFTTVLTQFAGFGPSAGRVGVGPLATAMKQYWLAGPSWGDKRNAVEDFVFKKSSEMKNRAGTIDRDIRLGLEKLEGKSGALADAQRWGFMGIAVADRWVSVPTWLAGYNKHIAEFPSDDAGAIEAGDRAVRLSQGAGGTKDVSSIQVDPRMQPFTMFYSPFNVLFNNLWDLGRRAGRLPRGGTPADYMDVFMRGMFFVVIPAVMADLITGKGPDEEDKEEEGTARAYATWAAGKVALYPLGTIPLLRDAASVLDLGFETNPSPAGRLGGAAAKLVKETAKGTEANPRVIAKNTADVLGMGLGLPIGQVTTSANNVARHAEEGDLRWLDLLFSRR